jgi:predicted nucleotide-binding protein
MTSSDELFSIANRLDAAAPTDTFDAAEPDLARLDEAASAAGRASSGSWLGYHARVYYKDLKPPPPGAHFSQEWGLMDMSYTSMGSTGEWREYEARELIAHLRQQAGDPDLRTIGKTAQAADEAYADAKAEMRSILLTELENQSDSYLDQLLKDLDAIQPLTAHELIEIWTPKGQKMTRDTIVVGQGTQVPPHMVIKAETASIRQSLAICAEGAKIARKAASHIQRKTSRRTRDARVGTNVFIGHGRSATWKDLKDFVQDRLQLPWDEFNRVPVAGVTNQARLAEMLDAAAVALVIMTAEDETAEGAMQARMNVIHEVGLFQGRLGFTKAIVLLEDGCEEFSNIQGLGQIRFPEGNISACFEEIRRVLEREDVISQ